MHSEINDPVQAKTPGAQKGFVEFKNVTFSYPGAEQPALTNISFKAQPRRGGRHHRRHRRGQIDAGQPDPALLRCGQRQCIDRWRGCARDDRRRTCAPASASCRSRRSCSPARIADNIRYGKDDATEDEVRHAAETAQALDFITDMPDGFDSRIAQGGTNVSGGQKQRLSIARALVRRPEIYIFDDSFSALDFKTDARLRRALRKETANSTVIIVAQRVSTVLDADRIIVLDEGRIVGMGTTASC